MKKMPFIILAFLLCLCLFSCDKNNEDGMNDKSEILAATELYNQSIEYVGEIITHNENGSEHSLATGFVISSDGKIVTNYHVIEGAYSADITINDIKYTVTSVLAYDANIDLAVLKIEANELTAATICKESPNVGSTIYTIGSSRGMTNTFSQGIITYADRVMDGVSYVQHDASITYGNSGGPLINAYGAVIGINTWGLSDSQNLNFAVSINELDNLVYGVPTTLSELSKNTNNDSINNSNANDNAPKQWFVNQFNIAKNQYINLLSANKKSKNSQISQLQAQISSYYVEYQKKCAQINQQCYQNGYPSGYRQYLLDNAKNNYDSSVKKCTEQINVLRQDIINIDVEIGNPSVNNILNILADNCGISKQQAQQYYNQYVS